MGISDWSDVQQERWGMYVASVCVLDREGSRVFASRALAIV